jgi:3-dehydroquinate dehydratase / shikimate dehydrogenase
MICIPIVAPTSTGALKDMKHASGIADIIELRLDFIKNINKKTLKKILSKKTKKVIITDRKKRKDLIKEAIKLKADFVDLDISIGEKTIKEIIKKKKQTKIIISFHNFKKTDKKEIIKKYNQIKKLNPDIIKIVTFANSINDNIIIFNLIKKAKKENRKIIALCMGKCGEISRILSPIFGAELTFGSLKEGKESAPGQITANALKNTYRINKLKNKNPKIFGLVGNPVHQSKGIIFHNRLFNKLNLNNIYLNFLVEDISSFIKNYKKIISGLSITIPFKSKVINHIDKLDPITKKIGAINTVIKKNNKLIGYNTDITGAIKAISSKTKIKGKKVLMVGAGGVARAIGYGIIKEKGKMTILNRTAKKAEKLARELRCNSNKLSQIKNQKNTDIIINATSVGMYPNINKTPIKKQTLKKIISKKTVVFDSIYNPEKTKLLKESKQLGCNVIGGYNMFINQAKEQFKLFTGRGLA